MLPDLVRRLVYATVPRGHLKQIDFPAGAEVQRPGYDGTTIASEPTPFVPKGVCFWELGCDAKPPKGRKKAEEDYNKRIQEHTDRLARGETDNLGEAVFVAVTALDWQTCADWAAERTEDHHYREVRALDSNALEHWIQDAPAVGLWLAQEIHGPLPGVMDVAAHWKSVMATLHRPLSPNVLLVDRQAIRDAFEKWLSGSAGQLAVKAASSSELLAVFCAWVHTLEPAKQDEVSSRAIIVESREAWQALATSQQGLILLPSPKLDADADLFGSACRQGHHVLRFAGFATPRGQAVEMGMMRRHNLQMALEADGIPPPEAHQLSETAGGNFTILRRRFSNIPDPAPWAKDTSLAPFMLVAAWEDARPGDQSVISGLTGRTYSDVQALMKQWRAEPDAPVRMVDGKWEFLSPVDAWEALYPYVTTTHMDLLERLAVSVLSEDNPAFDLPPKERIMANIRGKVWRHSSSLRRGIAEVLALGATREAESSVGTELQFGVRAFRIVRQLLPSGCDWKRWASLGDVLPLLIEAAPDTVLAAIEVDIASEHPQLVALMQQEDSEGGMGNIYHSGVLWALETCAWSRDHNQRAAICLARLSAIDPGGKWSNRPAGSLKSLFFSQRPQSVTSVAERLATISALSAKVPTQAWKMAISLFPTGHDMITDNPKPCYRSWAAGWVGNVTWPEYFEFVTGITKMACMMAEREPSHWPMLLDSLVRLPRPDYHRGIEGLKRSVAGSLTDSVKLSIWHKLREIIRSHTYFNDAEWALPRTETAALESIRDAVAPTDLVELHAPLFGNGWLDGDEDDTREEKEAEKAKAQRSAVHEIWDTHGEVGVLELARKAHFPWTVGKSLSDELGSEVFGQIIPEHLVSSEEPIKTFGAAFARNRILANGRAWAQGQPTSDWTCEQIVSWALQMECDAQTWDWLSGRGTDARSCYWSKVGVWGLGDLDFPLMARAVQELQEQGRSWSVLELLMQAKRKKDPITPDMVCAALESVIEAPQEGQPGSLDTHLIHDAFDYLHGSIAPEHEDRVANLEFQFLPLLDRFTRLPLVLQRKLAREPEFFIQCLTILYPEHTGSDEVPATDTPESPERFQRIWQLLHDWQSIPGMHHNGTISGQSLESWVRTVRQLAKDVDRLGVCDTIIGEVLSHSRPDTDGSPPLVPIRDVIEECESTELENGFAIGHHNLRGMTSRALYEGGVQERDLAVKYRQYATTCTRWPRTATILRRIADDYELQADREDERARARK